MYIKSLSQSADAWPFVQTPGTNNNKINKFRATYKYDKELVQELQEYKGSRPAAWCVQEAGAAAKLEAEGKTG